jgi:2-polyprenyl-3-methyl-5-hydroxy-6-metoxy-1,4-benzoquinol methylase
MPQKPMHIYKFDPAPFNTHMLLMEAVQTGSRVLEIGCASGYLGSYLINKKQCRVTGIEPDADAYEKARGVAYEMLIHGTAETFAAKAPAGELFDVILLGDVLEHMPEPEKTLASLKLFLKPCGYIAASLPNVAHYSIRWKLLTGSFDPEDAGILDRTHLHFYTKTSAQAMIEQAGFAVEKIRPSAGYIERFGARRLFGIGRKLLFAWPEFFAPQFIFIARPRIS